MRIAIVSPYGWTHPGGVTRHVEALTRELIAVGHDVRVLAPYDGDPRDAPPFLTSLGPTIGLPFNGAVSHLALTPYCAATLRRALRGGGFDVVHVHEPVAPLPGWIGVAIAAPIAPVVGTFHTYTENVLPQAIAATWGSRRNLNRLRVRIAVSEAAEWTGRRFFGGAYRIVPNGVTLPDGGVPGPRQREPEEPLRIAFVGQAVERKGLQVLLRAFEALREHVPTELSVIGVEAAELEPLLADTRGVKALGRVDDTAKHAALTRADVLCAPSLGGESFGMVLTEAFAAGTPVVASDIAGYRDVVDRRPQRAARPARRRGGAGLDAARPRARPAAARAARGRGRGERGALRVAARGRAGRRGLRGRARDAGALGRRGAAGPPARRQRPAPAGAAAAVARGAAEPAGARGARGPARGLRRRPRGCRPWRLSRHAAHRLARDRRLDRPLQPDLGAAGDRADVPLDGAARLLLARDPARRAAAHARCASPTPSRAPRSGS